MQIDSHKFNNWIKKPPLDLRFILVYGADNGMVSIIKEEIIKSFLPNDDLSISLIKYEYKSIKEDVSKLCDTWNSPSLLASNKIVLIENCTESISQKVKSVLDEQQSKQGDLTIFIAGEIRKNSPLVAAISKLKNSVVIPCYKPEFDSIKIFIYQWLKSNNVLFEKEVPEIMASFMPPNHLIIKQELEKVSLYAGERELTADNIYNIFANDSEMSIDALCYAFCMRNKEMLVTQLAKKHELNGSSLSIFVLRSLQNYLRRIIKIKNSIDGGKIPEIALSELRPPVFFKYREATLRVVNKLREEQLYGLLKYLLMIEGKIKSFHVDHKSFLDFALLTFIK